MSVRADTILRVDDVSRTFTTDAGPVHAVRSASLVVGAGELAVIMGRSGSGKSTLLHILGLMDRPDRGDLLLRGQSVAMMRARERDATRAKRIGFVFQAFHLIEHRTVLQNVLVPLVYARKPVKQRRAMAVEALDLVGLSERESALPRTLSGGEKQRAAVARALVHRPDLLLCDEPTGNLDRRNADNVMQLLRTAAASGYSVVIVTHDPVVARTADNIYDMVDGTLSRRRAEH